jgi:hypothetical protein
MKCGQSTGLKKESQTAVVTKGLTNMWPSMKVFAAFNT